VPTQIDHGAEREGLMMFVVWIACVLMVLAVLMLVAGVGAAGLWIAVISMGIVTVAFRQAHGRRGLHP
jgi:hypothetical protein